MTVNAEQVIKAVCDIMAVDEEEILGPRWSRCVADARYMAMFLINELVEPSRKIVGWRFHRTAAAVGSARKLVLWHLDHTPKMQRAYSDILVRLTHRNGRAA